VLIERDGGIMELLVDSESTSTTVKAEEQQQQQAGVIFLV